MKRTISQYVDNMEKKDGHKGLEVETFGFLVSKSMDNHI